MPGRLHLFWGVVLLLCLLACPAYGQSARGADTDDDPLESDDDDLLDVTRTPPPTPKNRTILLDVNPVDMDPKLIVRVYARVLGVLRQAEDLGAVEGRERLGQGQLYEHVVRTCQDIENRLCLARFASRANATLAVYGQLQDLDDIYLLELHLIDARTSKLRESVRVTIAKPVSDLEVIEHAAKAACRLTRHYGCSGATRATALAVAPVPTTTPARPPAPARNEPPEDEPAPGQADDDEDPIPVRPATPAPQAQPDETEDDDMDWEDEPDEPVAPSERVVGPTRRVQPTTRQQKTFIATGWTFIALSAASLAGGATTTALAFMAKADYDAAKPGEGSKARDARDRTLTMQWTSVGLYSAAGAFAAVGIPLLVLGYQEYPEEPIALLPAVAPEGLGLVLTTRF